jgi:branched-chain amino acid transport system ATP-binding protein
MLRLDSVNAGYHRTQVLRDVSLSVDSGELVTVIGANGAGKSTLLKTVVGLVETYSGSITVAGSAIKRARPEELVKHGVALVPEGRMLFGDLSVDDNLALGAYSLSGPTRAAELKANRDRVDALFPVLAQRATQPAATLSGGEQQMLAIARALMSGPRLLLLDEPSLGLAPRVIGEIFSVLDALLSEGVTIVLVEQDARLALKHATRGYVMRNGSIAVEGSASELLADEAVSRIYLGGGVHGPGS